MKKIVMFMLVLCLALSFSSCVVPTSENEAGIIKKVTCSRSVFYEVESLEDRYLELTFKITINDRAYVGKSIKVVALGEGSKEVYTEDVLIDESLKCEVTYSEHHPLSFKELTPDNIHTKQLVFYYEGNVVGTVDITTIKIVIL